ALQSIVSREIDPVEGAVVTITEIKAGTGALNTIPTQAIMRGTARILSPFARDTTEARLRGVVDGVAAAYRANAEIDYRQNYPPTITDAVHTQPPCASRKRSSAQAKSTPTTNPTWLPRIFLLCCNE